MNSAFSEHWLSFARDSAFGNSHSRQWNQVQKENAQRGPAGPGLLPKRVSHGRHKWRGSFSDLCTATSVFGG